MIIALLLLSEIMSAQLTADFTMDKDVGCPPLLVQFSNTSNNVSKVLWDFGDGTTSESFSPSHTYISPGKYIVSVKTWSENGTIYSTYIDYCLKDER